MDSNSKPWDGGDKTSDAGKGEKNQGERRDGALGRGTARHSCCGEENRAVQALTDAGGRAMRRKGGGIHNAEDV